MTVHSRLAGLQKRVQPLLLGPALEGGSQMVRLQCPH